MARVMLLVPQFWISGTITLARELQRGWPSEWPQPVIAVATKSGKPSVHWGRPLGEIQRATSTAWKPDVSGTADEIITLLKQGEFDFVHVTDPSVTASYRDWFYDLLGRLPVSWTLQLNGNRYEDVNWSRVTESKTFGRVAYHTPGFVPPELLRSDVEILSLTRPYSLRNPVDAQLVRTSNQQLVGTHGRIAPDKGIAHVASLSRHLNANVCIHGACPAGASPYIYGFQDKYLGHRVPAHHSWRGEEQGGTLRYAGVFSDGVEVAQHHAVHVSATRLGFSAGTEYSLLEAIDAGCRVVQPNHMKETTDLHQHTYEWEPRGITGALRDPVPSLVGVMLAALREDIYDQSHNRRVVAAHHDPARIARALVDAVAARI